MLAEAFRDGGFIMYPTAVFGFLAIAAGLLYLVRPESRYAPVVFCTGFLTVASGLLGTAAGLITTFRYLQQVPQLEQVKIAALGAAESIHNITLALLLTILGGMLTLGGVLRSVRRPAAV